jgi:hypothetical protein
LTGRLSPYFTQSLLGDQRAQANVLHSCFVRRLLINLLQNSTRNKSTLPLDSSVRNGGAASCLAVDEVA